MKKIFDYFDSRYRQSVISNPSENDGPAITISRQTGCDARQVAELVVDNLNHRYSDNRWKWIDKDIIYKVAEDLNTDPHRIENYYQGNEFSNVSEMIMAFSGNFVSDLRIKKAIKDVVQTVCREGHVVMVGRGGVSITRDIPDILHVRLVAPFYWRVENVMRKKVMDIETAEKYVIETDEKRFNLISTFLDKKPLSLDYLFDVTINRSTFSIGDIADLISDMYEKKIVRQIVERRKLNPVI